MQHQVRVTSKLFSPKFQVFIPPHTCRSPDDQRDFDEDTRKAARRLILPAGTLEAWARRNHSACKFSNRELGRFARKMILAGQSVDRPLRALIAANNGMYPPPEAPPVDPGNQEDDRSESDRKGIIPIQDDELAIVRPVFDQIAEELQYRGREEAGLLFGPIDTQIGTLFVRDKLGSKTASSFTLHTPTLNEVILGAKQWELELLAVIHCHPDGVWQPSGGDIRYVRDLFAHPKNGSASRFFMPLVVSGRLLPYLLFRDEPDRVASASLTIIG